jgi:hypothetical protein
MALTAAEMATERARDAARRRSLVSVSKPKPTPSLTPAQNAYGPSGVPSRADVQALQKRNFTRNQEALFGAPAPAPGGVRDIPAQEAPAPSQQPSAPRSLNWRDAAYNAQIAAVERALRDFETGATRRGERYGQDYLTSVRRLGYRPGEGFEAMPNLVEATQAATEAQAAEEAAPLVTPVSGAFDIEGQYDPYSTAAQGTRSMRDVFAGRGTLRSSDFARSFGEFQNRLNRQLEAMETSRGRFAEDLSQEIAAQRTGAQERREAAQREAMMRAAMAAAGGAGF